MYSLDTISDITFELTSHCNSKCPQCPRYDMEGRVRKDLNVSHIDTGIIEHLPIAKMKRLRRVSFIGNFGDPLMHPDLDEIIAFFSKQQIKISTNASLRTEKWWEQLGRHKNVSVIFCIDGIGHEHELYRRNTSYDKIIRNAKSFIKSGGNAHWQFIVFKHNEHQIRQAKRISDDLGFQNIEFMYSDRFDTHDKWPVHEDGQYLYDLEKSSQQTTLRESLGSSEGEKYWKALYRGKGEVSCLWSKKNSLYIHSDGCVYPCCMLASVQAGKNIEKLMLKKIIKDFKSIDLHNSDLEKILSSDVFEKYLPSSFAGNPFQHPICIESCNKLTGKYYNRDNTKVIDRQNSQQVLQ